jgi:hypothetical protein
MQEQQIEIKDNQENNISEYVLDPEKFENYIKEKKTKLYLIDLDDCALFLIDVISQLKEIFINGIKINDSIIFIPTKDMNVLIDIVRNYSGGSRWHNEVYDDFLHKLHEDLDELNKIIMKYVEKYENNIFEIVEDGFSHDYDYLPMPIKFVLNEYLDNHDFYYYEEEDYDFPDYVDEFYHGEQRDEYYEQQKDS